MVGISVNTQLNENNQTSINEIYQSSEQVCSANCSQTQSGNIIVIEGSNVGDVLLTQTCEADASCFMENSVESILTILQEIKQSAEIGLAIPSRVIGMDVNTLINQSDVEQRSVITQQLESYCIAEVDQVQQDNIIYLKSTISPAVGLTQLGNANADCVMRNIARARIDLQQKGDQTTSNSIISSAIIGAIIAVVLIIIIISAVRSRTKKNKGQGQGNGNSNGQRRVVMPARRPLPPRPRAGPIQN